MVGDYAKKITYRVVPYYIHQSIFSNASAAPIGYHQLMKSVVKEYQYIYTGQNVDVTRFDIEINNLFYTGANSSSEKSGSKTSNQDQKPAERTNANTGTGQGSAPSSQAAQLGRARPKRDPKLLKGFKGGNSSISGSGITTITSLGGGYGAGGGNTSRIPGGNGGCGGGAWLWNNATATGRGTGTTGQGYDGGEVNPGIAGNAAGGAGGGAGAQGGDATGATDGGYLTGNQLRAAGVAVGITVR